MSLKTILSLLLIITCIPSFGQSQEIGVVLGLERSVNSIYPNPIGEAWLEEQLTVESHVDRTISFYYGRSLNGHRKKWTLIAFEGQYGVQTSRFRDTNGASYWSPSQNDTVGRDQKFYNSRSRTVHLNWTPSYYLDLFKINSWSSGLIVRGQVGVGYRFNYHYEFTTVVPDGSEFGPQESSPHNSDFLDFRTGAAIGYRFRAPLSRFTSAIFSIELPFSLSYGFWGLDSDEVDVAFNIGYARLRMGIAF